MGKVLDAEAMRAALRKQRNHEEGDMIGKPWITAEPGRVFGEWTVIAFSHRKNGRKYWNVRCSCGTESLVKGDNLSGGQSTHCVLHKSRCGQRTPKQLFVSEYQSWRGMINRCCNPKQLCFQRYGGRGIKVCARWMVFESFLDDMGLKPSPQHTIDRFPDYTGNYEPGNCRWATKQEQVLNGGRKIRWLTFGGQTMPLSEWARELGIHRMTLKARLKRHPVEIALSMPKNGYGRNENTHG